nr:DNA-binding protein [Geodermatophilaceae bacterium]
MAKSPAAAAKKSSPATKPTGKAPAKAPAKGAAKSATKGAAKTPAKSTAKSPVKTTAKTPAKTTAKSSATAAEKAPGRPPEGWSARELAAVRKDLEAQLTQMRADYEQTLRAIDELQSQSSDSAGDDQADAGSKTLEREHEMS